MRERRRQPVFGDDILRGELPKAYEVRRERLVRFCLDLEPLLRRLCDDRGLAARVQNIETRAKNTDALMRKLDRFPEFDRLGDVHDLCGARIITFYQDDIPRIGDLLHDEFDVTWQHDHRATEPNAFGYQSLHLVGRLSTARRDLAEYRPYADLQVEFQVRTVLQHAWGVISRSLDYQSETEVPAPVRRKLFRVAALLETGDELFGLFRTEVEAIRDQYSRSAASSVWRDLPLNLDSLMATWDRLPADRVLEVAYAAGFRGRPDDAACPAPKRHTARRLISLATLAKANSMGDLADLMADVPAYQKQLESIRQLSGERGFTPVADVCDTVVMTILLRDPQLRDVGAVPFRREIEHALDVLQRAADA